MSAHSHTQHKEHGCFISEALTDTHTHSSPNSPHGSLAGGAEVKGSGKEQEDGLVLGSQLHARHGQAILMSRRHEMLRSHIDCPYT